MPRSSPFIVSEQLETQQVGAAFACVFVLHPGTNSNPVERSYFLVMKLLKFFHAICIVPFLFSFAASLGGVILALSCFPALTPSEDLA